MRFVPFRRVGALLAALTLLGGLAACGGGPSVPSTPSGDSSPAATGPDTSIPSDTGAASVPPPTEGQVATTERTPAAAQPTNRTLRVPADFVTIQSAVDAAEPGDLVLIAPGVYAEAVVIRTPSVVIRGEEDRKSVV